VDGRLTVALTEQPYQSLRESAVGEKCAVLIVIDGFREAAFRNTTENIIRMAVTVMIRW